MARSKAVVPAKQELPSDLEREIKLLLVGQDSAIEQIVPFIEMYLAGLCMPGRPIATILLLGPTGSGKTHTVEAIAQVLHGSDKNILRVDCGEYQQDHEVAKLIGAPPGYLGHRETQAILSQPALLRVTSESCPISIVLFDEIEKGSPALERLLLGVCDKATLRNGDNSTVSFEHAMIFLTSNLGEESIQRTLTQQMGFSETPQLKNSRKEAPDMPRLARMGQRATKRRFSPAMVNRIDLQLTYKLLERADYVVILDRIIRDLATLIINRNALKAFFVDVTVAGKNQLLDDGISAEYGARNLKRTVQRHLVTPLCKMMLRGEIKAGAQIWLDHKNGDFVLKVKDS